MLSNRGEQRGCAAHEGKEGERFGSETHISPPPGCGMQSPCYLTNSLHCCMIA